MTAPDGLRENAEKIRALRERAAALEGGQLAELAKLCLRESGGDPSPDDAAVLYAAAGGDAGTEPVRFAAFCRALADRHPEPKRLLTALAGDGSGEPEPIRRTAFLSTAQADNAFMRFSARESGLNAVKMSSFNAACEEVYYGRCGYCILPQWSSEEGTYAFFPKLLTKYDLKLCLGCDVQNQDATVRFALLRRGAAPLPPDTAAHLRAQISVVLSPERELEAFLSSVRTVGAATEHLALFPLTYEDRFSFCLTLAADPAALTALLLFLEASGARYTTDGIFEVIP